jgi:hypothetical protein
MAGVAATPPEMMSEQAAVKRRARRVCIGHVRIKGWDDLRVRQRTVNTFGVRKFETTNTQPTAVALNILVSP